MAANFHTSDLVHSIVKARVTILQQLHSRGYNIDTYNHFDVNEIYTLEQTKQLSMLLEAPNPDLDAPNPDLDAPNPGQAAPVSSEVVSSKGSPRKTFVHFYLDKPMRPKDLVSIISDVFESGDDSILTRSDTLIIITRTPKIESVVTAMKQIWEEDGYFIIVKDLQSLQFNVMRHILVPEHRVLSAAEVAEQRVRLDIINDSQWPTISRFDPVAEAIGMRPNEICEILRPSKTAIRAKYWRLCVNNSIEKKKPAATKDTGND